MEAQKTLQLFTRAFSSAINKLGAQNDLVLGVQASS